MEYIDERILALRHKKISGMRIKAKGKKELFFNGLIEMILPNDFSDMKEEAIRKVFPADKSPAYLKTTRNGELTMSLDLLEGHEPLTSTVPSIAASANFSVSFHLLKCSAESALNPGISFTSSSQTFR